VRASFDALPQPWTHGHLILNNDAVRWSRGGRVRSKGVPLPVPIRVVKVREVQGSEKKRLKPRRFRVIEVTTRRGELALGVPRGSVAVVEQRLRAT
jgi:hypothetical protein